jgi:dTDP-3-amino-3,4,6-trideoxy-alpha-D-glucose transaminase
VVASGWFILGPEVAAFENEFAAASGAAHAIGVGNGTDAIALILKALGIGPGDEVITTPLSAAYTALAVVMAGARPVFADVEPERLTLDPQAVAAAVTPRTRAVLPVHLYGQPADMQGIAEVASRHGLAVVEDCCQAHLALTDRRHVGTVGVAGAFSFYPTKNLGALGDGGAVVTNDAGLAERVKRLRNGGQTDRYRHDLPGVNSRLDEMQAAILRARLPYLPGWTARRRSLAADYRQALAAAPVRLLEERDTGHVYHLFVVRTGRRAALQEHLATNGIEALVHYPIPIPHQTAVKAQNPQECPIATVACGEVLSLPLYPALTSSDLADVASAVCKFQEG